MELVIRMHRASGVTTKRIRIKDVDGTMRSVFRAGTLPDYANSVAARKGWLGGEQVLSVSADLTDKD